MQKIAWILLTTIPRCAISAPRHPIIPISPIQFPLAFKRREGALFAHLPARTILLLTRALEGRWVGVGWYLSLPLIRTLREEQVNR